MEAAIISVALPPIGRDFRVGMSRARAGTASGIASTSRPVGSSPDVVVAGSVLAAGRAAP
jgi:hypothetical protein